MSLEDGTLQDCTLQADERLEGLHPLDAALRLLLELSAWGGCGASTGMLTQGDWEPYAAGISAAAGSVLLWVTFAVPDDPSRSGRGVPVPIDGRVRLALELLVLAGPAALLIAVGGAALWWGFAQLVLVVAHHLFSFRRWRWLVSQRRPAPGYSRAAPCVSYPWLSSSTVGA